MKLVLLLLLISLSAYADDRSIEEAIKSALASEIRTEKEKARDANRKPIQTLQFMGLKDTMKVVELLPGGGWYTKILAPVLREKGALVVALGTGRIADSLLNKEGFDKITIGAPQSKIYRKEGDRFYTLEKANIDIKDADMVLTFRNYHNFSDEGRLAMNNAAWNALKEGGIYGVVDHTQRHMQADNPENRRRFDPVKAILEIQSAGFELVDYSDLHYRPDDELRYEVGRKTVTGNTDRWTLKFKKIKR